MKMAEIVKTTFVFVKVEHLEIIVNSYLIVQRVVNIRDAKIQVEIAHMIRSHKQLNVYVLVMRYIMKQITLAKVRF